MEFPSITFWKVFIFKVKKKKKKRGACYAYLLQIFIVMVNFRKERLKLIITPKAFGSFFIFRIDQLQE